ncbi:hypothetical protein [Nocardia sp. CC227C]|uniref:hypothetical protein n=1 Tax=Nocardia sp. CC227C TaxID=3044562 RepID=UPI00278C570C|nr:hypothetical protein [Nocardia sp. CC227C]
MSEKRYDPQPNSPENLRPIDTDADAASGAETPHPNEFQLTWAVGDALLQSVYDTVGRKPEEAWALAVSVARQQVYRLHALTPDVSADPRILDARTDAVASHVLELAASYEELTTGDLQGIVDALASDIVRGALVRHERRGKSGTHGTEQSP